MQYSISAMPQLTRIASSSGDSLKRRWPYQAKVMKMLEPISSRIGRRYGEMNVGGMGFSSARGHCQEYRVHVAIEASPNRNSPPAVPSSPGFEPKPPRKEAGAGCWQAPGAGRAIPDYTR